MDGRGTLTIPECAKYLGIGRSTAYELARTGRLPVLKLGRRLLIPKAALERLLEGPGATLTTEGDDGG